MVGGGGGDGWYKQNQWLLFIVMGSELVWKIWPIFYSYNALSVRCKSSIKLCLWPSPSEIFFCSLQKAPVWEITGAEFSKSTTHTADGISIRCPRVTRIRDDKDWKTANDLPHLKVQYFTSIYSFGLVYSASCIPLMLSLWTFIQGLFENSRASTSK